MKKHKKYFIYTFGCQANKSDSERIAGDYQARGFTQAKKVDQTDEIIINTCSVRQRAEDRIVGLLHNLDKKFTNKPKPKIILTGCMIHHGKRKLLKSMPLVDEILPIMEVGFNQLIIRRDKHHAWVPISTGCNSFCSYCIVPFSRGREKSRPMADILQEIKDLINQGYTEITLLGQNVNSYGLEKTKSKQPFAQLLEKICTFPQLKIIRFMTANPWDFSNALINCIAANPQIDRYLHLPVQSGSDKILKLMNRGYTKKDYLTLINQIRQKIPHISIGTDIIVGFPTETKKDFRDTVDLAKQADFKVSFNAQYSPRPHTLAAKKYKDNVSPQEKKRRWQILEDLINIKNIKKRPKIIK